MSFSDTPPPEQPYKPTTTPLPAASFYPPDFTAPTFRDNQITLNISGTNYAGTLRTNWSDRISRINSFNVAIMRLLLRFLGAVDFTRTLVVNFKNPFNVEGRTESQTITRHGFDAIISWLMILNDKIDNLHDDIELVTPVASVVEHWQLKKEANRPQCIFLWGEWTVGEVNIGAPKWQTAVPYYDFSLASGFDNTFGYWKGERQGILTLTDNSKVIIYARDDDEITRIFNKFLLGIRSDMKAEAYVKKGEYSGPPFSTRYVRLRRIDYYSTGQLRGPMDDYRWFTRQA